MIIRPRRDDHLVIGKYTGKVIVGVGWLMLIPLVVSLIFREWDTALDFLIGMGPCFIFGYGTQLFCRTDKDLAWSHGLVVASGSWLWATLLGSLPHYLSGHYASYLDAMFDVMSGYTTTGLYLLQDLDHISYGFTMWRMVLTYAGGQGIVVIALTFLFKGTAGAYKVYVGEGKDERLLPNVVQTARAIWLVSLVYLAVGWVIFTAAGLYLGQNVERAVLDGLWIFMGGFSTGGFAPQSYNSVWFHSLLYEVIGIIFFTAGSFNFALHWAVWTGNRKEIRRNIETISFFVTVTALTMIATFWLAKEGVYPDAMALFRKTFFQVISGHTTTGWSTIYAKQFVSQWGTVGLLVVSIAMMLGGSAASTAGGIKGMRVGLIAKSIIADVRRLISPESAVVRERYHHVRDNWLEDRAVKSVLTITAVYFIMYTLSTLLGTLYGYDLSRSMFEGVSVAANTGLSCGVTDPSMPDVMKGAYIVFMWLGRMEFMSAFALVGYGLSVVRGR